MLAVAAVIGVLGWWMQAGSGHSGSGTTAGTSATPATQAAVAQLLDHNDSIQAEQESIREEALEAIPAPCCASFSAATCCCECNLARATWGLVKHLIADEGRDAAGVRREVTAWYAEVNPRGFSGDACFTNGCGRAFRRNGCGGMDRNDLVF